jgi:hypothetical protein
MSKTLLGLDQIEYSPSPYQILVNLLIQHYFKQHKQH